MKPLEKEVFVCIDCESTGLDPQGDRIIEIAAMLFTMDQDFDSMEALVDPQMQIPPTSMAIHHITQEMVTGKPLIEQVLPEFLRLIGRHTIIGHGVGFDIQLIVNAAARAGIPCTIQENAYLDTLRMARIYGDSPTNSLDQLRMHFNVSYEGAHRALSDVIVNRGVFRHLAKRYKSLSHIQELLDRPIFMKCMPLGKHKGRLLKEIPLEYLIWASKKDFDQDLLYSLHTEIKRRRKGNLFSQAGNPFYEL